MSLLQVHLHNKNNIEYKDVFIEVKANVDFNTIFNKIEETIKKDKIIINKSKIVINDSLHFLEDTNQKFFKFILDNNIECDDIDNINIVCFVSIEVPELLYSEILTKCLKEL